MLYIRKTGPSLMTFVLFCLIIAITSRTAASQQTYTITNLGTLGGGRSVALDLNDSGQVTGYSETGNGARHAYLYTGGSMLDLGTLGGADSYAYRISESGFVTGSAQNADGLFRPFIAIIGSPMFDLSSLDNRLARRFSAAFGINRLGQLVGYLETDDAEPQARAFLYTGSSIIDLGTFGGMGAKGIDINTAGQVIGLLFNDHHEGHKRSFLSSGGTTRDLGSLGGKETAAADVNDSGQVVGYAELPDGAPHAFLYTGSSLLDLGTLPGGSQSLAHSINNSGHVVGASDTAARTLRAFVYSGGVMRDLNTLIPANSGWMLTEARGINNAGQIVGTGIRNGQQRAFLLTPVGSAASSTEGAIPNPKRQTQHRVRRGGKQP